MPYLIQTRDKAGNAGLRASLEAEHRAWLNGQTQSILAAGALLTDDGGELGGGVYIIDAETRAEAEDFIRHDPFTHARLFASVEITRWRKAFFNFHNYLPEPKG